MTLDDGQRSEGEITENRRVGENRKHLRARPAVVVADCMHVPLRTNSCDAAICIAVMHHLSTPQRRKRCIEELARIVKPGGLVNVQAWAMDQEEDSRRRFAANDVFVPFNAQPKYLQIGDQTRDDSMLSEGTSTAQMYANALNAEYDDKKGLVVFKRYCHLYRLGELDQIASQVPGTQVIESGFESGNYYIIFEVQQEE
jgi:alkylated DNA repair protein alkB family protein 8